MKDELDIYKNWRKRNWKWFLPISLIAFLLFFGSILNLTIDGNITDFARAYTDNSLYEQAIEKAKINKRVIEIIGEIEPIDKLAILEGNIVYSNDYKSVAFSVRLQGNIGTGKMDVSADKIANKWEYKKINIRCKKPKEEIEILKFLHKKK